MAYVPAVNTFGMLDELGNNFLAAQQRNAPIPNPDGSLPPQQPGFFARILSGENPFAQSTSQPVVVAAPAIPPTTPGTGIANPPNYYARVASIENPSGDPRETSPTGATGQFQFLPSTWKQYGGGGDIHGDQTDAMMRFTADNNAALSSGLGRPPTASELYLAHQQGAQGALKLLTNPTATPAQLGLGDAVARNGGNPDAPASLFTSKWGARFAGVPSPFGEPQGAGGQASPGMAPVRLAGQVPTPNTVPAATASLIAADYQNTPPTPANWVGTRDDYIRAYRQANVPAATVAAAGQGAAITVPGYEAKGPLTRAQVAAAPDSDASMPGTDEWDAAAAKLPGGRLNMTSAPASPATATPMGQRAPQYSMQAINMMLNNPYQAKLGAALLQAQLQQGQVEIKDVPVKGDDGTFAGTQPWLVSKDGTMAMPVPGAAIDTSKVKDTQKLQVIGEGAYGEKQYGIFNPSTGTVTPYAPPTGVGAPANAADPNLHGEAFMATLDPQIATQVRAIVEGRAPYPTGMLLKTPYGQKLAAYVTQADPAFEAGNATARVASRKEFETGGPNSVAGTITAGNATIQHLGELSNAAEKLSTLSSGSIGPLTGWANAAITAYQSGKQAPEVSNFNNIVARFGEEATKFYRGIGGSEADVQRDIANLSPDMSPDQLRGAIATQVRLMADKIQALQTRWNTAMGPMVPDFPIISAKTQGVIEKIGGRAALGGAPQGTAIVTPGAPPRLGSVPIPMGAAAYLKANPGLRPEFDQKYGAGASDQILGPPR